MRARDAAFSEILSVRRKAHGARYASKGVRDSYRGTSKQFSLDEAKGLLGKPLPEAVAVRVAHEWPPWLFLSGSGETSVAVMVKRGQAKTPSPLRDGKRSRRCRSPCKVSLLPSNNAIEE